MTDVIRRRSGRRTVGAKGIGCRVGESIFGMDAKNLYRGSDTIVYLAPAGTCWHLLALVGTAKQIPTWMLANYSVLKFSHWLKAHNAKIRTTDKQVGFYYLDLYNPFSLIEAAPRYLEKVDPETAKVTRGCYSCLISWADDPGLYAVLKLHSPQEVQYVKTVMLQLDPGQGMSGHID